VNRVADVHTQVDRPDHLVRLQIVEANCRWRRSTGHKAFTGRAQPTAKALARTLLFVVDVALKIDDLAATLPKAHPPMPNLRAQKSGYPPRSLGEPVEIGRPLP